MKLIITVFIVVILYTGCSKDGNNTPPNNGGTNPPIDTTGNQPPVDTTGTNPVDTSGNGNNPINRDSTKVVSVIDAVLITNKNNTITLAGFSNGLGVSLQFDSRVSPNGARIQFVSAKADTAVVNQQNSNETDFIYAYSTPFIGRADEVKPSDSLHYDRWTITGLDKTKAKGYNRIVAVMVKARTKNDILLVRVADKLNGDGFNVDDKFYKDALSKAKFGTVVIGF